MKSAYELAMEKLGGVKQISKQQKQKLAEIDSLYDSRKAEAQLRAQTAIEEAAGDSEKAAQIRDDLARELRKLDERREAKKDKVRDG